MQAQINLQDYPLGKALRQSQVAIVRGEGECKTLFVHAGILPGLLSQLQPHRAEEGSPEELLQDLNDIAAGSFHLSFYSALHCHKIKAYDSRNRDLERVTEIHFL